MSATPTLQRFELKYQIPVHLIEPLSAYVETYCKLDRFGAKSPDGYYVINSLYLDTPGCLFLENKRANLASRFNMRIRSYGLDPKLPYFLEIKYRHGDTIKKERARIVAEDWASHFIHGDVNNCVAAGDSLYGEKFFRLVQTYNASPKILTQYRRRAYISQIDDYARITFDRNLSFHEEDIYNVKPCEDKMCHYDNTDIFLSADSPVVLEIKCLERVPFWIIDMVQAFQLVRSSFSKYENSITALQERLEPEMSVFS